MSYFRNPSFLERIIDAVDKDFNTLADTFVEATDDVSFEVFYSMCMDANLLAVYDLLPTNLKSIRQVRTSSELITEIALTGAKRIWINPHNPIRKQIAGLYMISILYTNQPMPGFPVKIPMSTKEIFCIVEQAQVLLISTVKKVPKMRFMLRQAGAVLQSLFQNDAIESTFIPHHYNILPESRAIITKYDELDVAAALNRIKEKQNPMLTLSSSENIPKGQKDNNEPMPSTSQGCSGSVPQGEQKFKKKYKYKVEKAKTIDSLEDSDEFLNDSWSNDLQAQKLEKKPPNGCRDLCLYDGESSDDEELNSDDDDISEEDEEVDGCDLLLSARVPEIEKNGKYLKTAANLEESEKYLKYIMKKNSGKPNILKSKGKSKTENGSDNMDHLVNNIKAVKEKRLPQNSRSLSQKKEFTISAELLNLKKAADESVKLAYGITCQAKRMDEDTWLTKDVKDATKALRILSMHEEGTLEKNEGFRLVTKYISFKDTHVLAERAGPYKGEENFCPTEKRKRKNWQSLEERNRNSLRDPEQWDPIFYQQKYINNYHLQLQNAARELPSQKTCREKMAERFVKRYRLEQELQLPIKSSQDARSEKGEKCVENKDVLVKNKTTFNIISPKKTSRKQVFPMPLQLQKSANDVEMSEEIVQLGNSSRSVACGSDSVCKSLVVSPRKNFSYSMLMDMEISDESSDDASLYSQSDSESQAEPNSTPRKTPKSSSPAKVLSMPNLDSFFGHFN